MLDPQLRRGLLDICVLAVLCRGESYGYKIIKDLSACIELSESTLYPILKRLESAGCLGVNSIEHNGRLRKMYKLTDVGRGQINGFLEGWHEMVKIQQFIMEGYEHDKK